MKALYTERFNKSYNEAPPEARRAFDKQVYFFCKILGIVLLELKNMECRAMFGKPGLTNLGVFILQLKEVFIIF